MNSSKEIKVNIDAWKLWFPILIFTAHLIQLFKITRKILHLPNYSSTDDKQEKEKMRSYDAFLEQQTSFDNPDAADAALEEKYIRLNCANL